MKRFAILLALLLCSGMAQAQVVAPKMQRIKFSGLAGAACTDAAGSCKVLSAVALNDSTAAHRTFTLPVGGYSELGIQIDYTYSAASAVILTCYGSENGGSTYAHITSTNISAGTGTVTDYADSYAVSASKNFILDYGVRKYDKVQCVISGTGAGAGDLVNVYAVAAVGQ